MDEVPAAAVVLDEPVAGDAKPHLAVSGWIDALYGGRLVFGPDLGHGEALFKAGLFLNLADAASKHAYPH